MALKLPANVREIECRYQVAGVIISPVAREKLRFCKHGLPETAFPYLMNLLVYRNKVDMDGVFLMCFWRIQFLPRI